MLQQLPTQLTKKQPDALLLIYASILSFLIRSRLVFSLYYQGI